LRSATVILDIGVCKREEALVCSTDAGRKIESSDEQSENASSWISRSSEFSLITKYESLSQFEKQSLQRILTDDGM
jgi:hypothetical protein